MNKYSNPYLLLIFYVLISMIQVLLILTTYGTLTLIDSLFANIYMYLDIYIFQKIVCQYHTIKTC